MTTIIINEDSGQTIMSFMTKHEVMSVIDNLHGKEFHVRPFRNGDPVPIHKTGLIRGVKVHDGILSMSIMKGSWKVGIGRLYSFDGELKETFPILLEKRANGLHTRYEGNIYGLRDQVDIPVG